MRDFLTALALAMALEGMAYALFPRFMQRMILSILTMPPDRLRLAGLAMAGLGVGAVWLVRGAILTP